MQTESFLSNNFANQFFDFQIAREGNARKDTGAVLDYCDRQVPVN